MESHHAEVVRSRQKKTPARFQYAAQLSHRASWIGDMFDGFAGDQRIEARIRVCDGLYISYLPGDAAQFMSLCVLLAHLDSHRRKVGRDDLAWGIRLPRQPAGEAAASTADFQNPLAGQVLWGDMRLDQPMPGRVGLGVNGITRVPLVIGVCRCWA